MKETGVPLHRESSPAVFRLRISKEGTSSSHCIIREVVFELGRTGAFRDGRASLDEQREAHSTYTMSEFSSVLLQQTS